MISYCKIKNANVINEFNILPEHLRVKINKVSPFLSEVETKMISNKRILRLFGGPDWQLQRSNILQHSIDIQ